MFYDAEGTATDGGLLANILPPKSLDPFSLGTMRTEDIARRLISDGDSTIIKVEPMSETDALRLLRNNWVETSNTGLQWT